VELASEDGFGPSAGSNALLSNRLSLLTKTPAAYAAKARPDTSTRKLRDRSRRRPMTAHFGISDVARQHRGANTTVALAASDDFESNRSIRLGDRLAAVLATTMSAGLQHFLSALHDSRRKQAAIELARRRDLIYDPETGIAFGMDRTLHPRS